MTRRQPYGFHGPCAQGGEHGGTTGARESCDSCRPERHERVDRRGPCTWNSPQSNGVCKTSSGSTSRPWWRRSRPPTSDEPAYTHYIRRMGEDGWLGLGWPVEYGGQARGAIDQMIFVEESHWAGVPLAAADPEQRRSDAHGPRHRRAEAADPARHRPGRGPLLHRLHRAVGGHRPGVAADAGRTRRGRVRDQRPEDLHERDPVRRLRLAGGAHRPRCAQAQGPVRLHRAGRHPRVPLGAVGHDRRRHHELDVLRGRPGSGREPGRSREPGLEADHQPAQSRTSGDLPGLGAAPEPDRGAPMGAGASARRRTHA